MRNTKTSIYKMVLSALFMAIGLILPFFIGQIPEIGKRLSPMHLPILVCGFVCGWPYGLVVGFITPLFRSLLFNMPVMMPNAVGMAFELATYGAVSGLLYAKLPKKNWAVYASLVGAMISGRIAWGIVSVPLYGIIGDAFTFKAFIAGALTTAAPAIILQIVLVPLIIIGLKRAGLMRFQTA